MKGDVKGDVKGEVFFLFWFPRLGVGGKEGRRVFSYPPALELGMRREASL